MCVPKQFFSAFAVLLKEFVQYHASYSPHTSIPSPAVIKQWSWHFDRSLCNHINFCPAKTVPFVSKLLSTQPAILWSLSGKYVIQHEIAPPGKKNITRTKVCRHKNQYFSYILNRAEQHLRNTHIYVCLHTIAMHCKICKIACRAILSIYHSGDQIGISMARYKRGEKGGTGHNNNGLFVRQLSDARTQHIPLHTVDWAPKYSECWII